MNQALRLTVKPIKSAKALLALGASVSSSRHAPANVAYFAANACVSAWAPQVFKIFVIGEVDDANDWNCSYHRVEAPSVDKEQD